MATDRNWAASNCEALTLRFEVAKEKFHSEKFNNAMASFEGSGGGKAVCHTAHPDKNNYHVHFNWAISKDDLRLTVSYYEPNLPLEENEKEPYAETFMAWLGDFFKNETAHAAVSAYFRYDSPRRQSRFPLPIKLPIVPDLETEIDGVSFSLPSKPNGVDGVLITTDSGNVAVQVRGGIRVTFKEFEPLALAESLAVVVLKLTYEKEQDAEKTNENPQPHISR